MTDSLLALLQEREIDANTSYVRNIKSLLLQQGRSVYDANDKMAEKLSRIITGKEIARHRRLRQQISSVKELVFQLMDEPKVDAGLTTSGAAEIKMSMERKLTLMPKQSATGCEATFQCIGKSSRPGTFQSYAPYRLYR